MESVLMKRVVYGGEQRIILEFSHFTCMAVRVMKQPGTQWGRMMKAWPAANRIIFKTGTCFTPDRFNLKQKVKGKITSGYKPQRYQPY